LLSYRSEAPHAERAHPTEEHFLPLLVALGAASDADDVIAIDGGMTYGVLSMDSFAWGVGASGSTRGTPVHRGANSLADDAVAAICHPLRFFSPQVQP
jgi:hypothetical protein